MKIIKIIFFVFIIINNAYANEDFENWLNSFTKTALDQGISQETVSIVLKMQNFYQMLSNTIDTSLNFMKIQKHI